MKARLALLLAAALGAASCASIVRDEVAAPPDGGNVAIRTGKPLIVSLPPDPDTGYGWVLRNASPNLVVIGGPDYTPLPRPPGLVGVANTTAYRFRAGPPGTGSLEFVWTVPPGSPPAPERVVRYDVQIDPAIPLVTDFFGTVGLQSVRGGDYAPPSTAPLVKSDSAPPQTPASSETPAKLPQNDVKYWSN